MPEKGLLVRIDNLFVYDLIIFQFVHYDPIMSEYAVISKFQLMLRWKLTKCIFSSFGVEWLHQSITAMPFGRFIRYNYCYNVSNLCRLAVFRTNDYRVASIKVVDRFFVFFSVFKLPVDMYEETKLIL